MDRQQLLKRLETKQELREHYLDRVRELDTEIAGILHELGGNEREECLMCGS